MISLTTASLPGQTIAQGVGPTTNGAKASGDDFVLSLAAFLDAIQPPTSPTADVVGDGTARQGDAASGKDLPDAATTIDPALVPPTMPLPVFAFQVPVEAVTATAISRATGGTVSPMPVPAPIPAALQPTALPMAAPAALSPTPALLRSLAANDVAPTMATPPGGSPVAIDTAPVQPATADPVPTVAPMIIDTPVVARMAQPDRPVALHAPLPAPVAADAPVAGTTAPAQQVFAAAIHAATNDGAADKPLADAARDVVGDIAPVVAGTTPLAAPAMAKAQDAALDMRHERWPHSMIDHIEGLRDAADAISTRIRLIPDALGGIDVSVQRDGDTVHVQFQAEQAATRAMLTDAQPKLAEIAEQRGLRLGDTSVSAGAAGTGQMGSGPDRQPAQQQRQSATHMPNSPVSAFAADAAGDDADTRIA